MSFVAQVAVGIDVGTSTCQAWFSVNGNNARAIEIGTARGSATERYYRSLILDIQGKRHYGHAALLTAMSSPASGVLHRNFKAYMKDKCPLKVRYTQDQACELFRDMAVHFTLQLLPAIEQRCTQFPEGRIRVDLVYTVPGGWARDPAVRSRYSGLVAEIAKELAEKVASPRFVFSPMILEEPVAAYLAAESDGYLPATLEGPVLVVDGGGGTLDVAACVRDADGAHEVVFTSSIGTAGEAFFEAFTRELGELGAFSPELPINYRDDPTLLAGLETVYREYHQVAGKQFSRILHRQDRSDREINLSFDLSALRTRLLQSREATAVRAFFDTMFAEYSTVTGKPLLEWGCVLVAGGLSQLPVFLDLFPAEWGPAQALPSPQEAIATGARIYGERGASIIGARRVSHILGVKFLDLANEKYFWAPLVPRHAPIRAGSDGFTAQGERVAAGSGLIFALAWTDGPEMDQTRFEIYDGRVEFSSIGSKGDSVKFHLGFDDLLDIVLQVENEVGERKTVKVERARFDGGLQ
jgi:hypothetical protein